MKAKSVGLKQSGKISIENWSLPKLEDIRNKIEEIFEGSINEAIKEALEIATRDYECYAGIGKGGRIWVQLPLCDDEVEWPEWVFSLQQIVLDEILALTDHRDGKVHDEDDRANLTSLRESLLSAASEIESVLKLD